MADFTPITTQEEFEERIKSRLNQQKRADAAAYEGWINPEDHAKALEKLQEQIKSQKDLTDKIATLQAENGQLNLNIMKSNIADEMGLDRKWLSRISGSDEAAIRADVESLLEMLPSKQPAPLATPEAIPSDTKEFKRDLAMKQMIKELNGG